MLRLSSLQYSLTSIWILFLQVQCIPFVQSYLKKHGNILKVHFDAVKQSWILYIPLSVLSLFTALRGWCSNKLFLTAKVMNGFLKSYLTTKWREIKCLSPKCKLPPGTVDSLMEINLCTPWPWQYYGGTHYVSMNNFSNVLKANRLLFDVRYASFCSSFVFLEQINAL